MDILALAARGVAGHTWELKASLTSFARPKLHSWAMVEEPMSQAGVRRGSRRIQITRSIRYGCHLSIPSSLGFLGYLSIWQLLARSSLHFEVLGSHGCSETLHERPSSINLFRSRHSLSCLAHEAEGDLIRSSQAVRLLHANPPTK
jgi:hypothetical protein